MSEKTLALRIFRDASSLYRMGKITEEEMKTIQNIALRLCGLTV